MCENKMKVCFIGSGIVPNEKLREYLKGSFETVGDVGKADIAFKLESVNDQDSLRDLKIALYRMIIVLDEQQLNALIQ